MSCTSLFKKIIIILIASFLAIGIFGCDSSVSKNEKKREEIPQKLGAKSEAVKDWKLVRSQDKKLSLKIPQDWQVMTADELALGPGKLFAVFGPKEGEYTSNIQVSKETAGAAALSTYIEQFEKNSRDDKSTKELKILEEGEVDSPLGEAYRKRYKYVLDNEGKVYDLTFDALYLRDENDYYVIQLVAPDNLFEDIKGTFNNILGTLIIK